MPVTIQGIISAADEGKKIFAKKSKSVDEKTVSASKKEALALKVEAEITDGWFVKPVKKKSKRSVRMTKPKPADRQLEDDVWSILYKMGFKELNEGRRCMIQLGEQSPPRQIDVFAKDDETVFVVECTHAQEAGPKSVKSLVDKINGMREDVIKVIHSHYGRTPRLKVKWAIATRNVEWRVADRKRAEESKIGVITEADIAYFDKLTDLLKEGARYQFLARYLKGEKVEGLKIEVPATRGTMGGTTFYNFLISPFDLLKIGYISHKTSSSVNDFETYQRMIKPSRLKNIAKYVDEGGKFPTNIVINFKSRAGLQFHKIQSFEDTTFGKLVLPGQYAAAWVIDGQHRLYSFSYTRKQKGRAKPHVLPVLAFANLAVADEMKMFVDINCEQVRVSRGLLNEIYASLHHDSDDLSERLEAQYARIALRLDEMQASPIRDRVITVSKDKDHYRCLTLTSLADGINENKFLGAVSGATITPGPLTDLSGDLDLTLEKAADVFVGYFGVLAKGVHAHWMLGDAKGGFLCTNNGLRALLRLLRELITFVEREDGVQLLHFDAQAILKKVSPYLVPVVDYFKAADVTEVQAYRSRQALDGVKQNCLGLMGIIGESIPEFSTPELKEYLGTRDKEGTNIARRMVVEINEIISEDVIIRLRAHFGTTKDAWWWKGVPQPIREKCITQQNKDNGEKESWRYLSLADYPGIITNNWPLFDKAYDFEGGSSKNKSEKVHWISKINKIRQTTVHPEKGLISKDEVKFVQDTLVLVKTKILGASAQVATTAA
jgi:DNA sulfur modification protein DndB